MEKKDQGIFSPKYDPPPNYDSFNFRRGPESLPLEPADDEESEFEGEAEVLKAPTPLPFVSNLEPRTLTYHPPSLVYEDIHKACIRYVKEHWCYSSRFVKQMALTEIKNDCAFHYVLETFCERRESAFVAVPYTGQFIDGPENGPPPAPWDIPVQPPALYQKGKVKVEIPHTACVRPCAACLGNGCVRCKTCSGTGGNRCSYCEGSGRRFTDECEFCYGVGHFRCSKCKGKGQIQCKKCKGRANVKLFGILIVTWINFGEEFMSNTHNLPKKFLKSVTGNKMLFEDDKMLSPIATAPDESINQASASIMKRQREDHRNLRILKQRHVLRAVPLTKVSYEFRGKDGEFYVYGQEKNVYFEEYPQRYCCCTCL